MTRLDIPVPAERWLGATDPLIRSLHNFEKTFVPEPNEEDLRIRQIAQSLLAELLQSASPPTSSQPSPTDNSYSGMLTPEFVPPNKKDHLIHILSKFNTTYSPFLEDLISARIQECLKNLQVESPPDSPPPPALTRTGYAFWSIRSVS